MMQEDKKQEIIAVLQQRISHLECPMCHSQSFSIIDGYILDNPQESLNSYSLGGNFIPSVAIVCNNCGFISRHALGSLGLINKNA